MATASDLRVIPGGRSEVAATPGHEVIDDLRLSVDLDAEAALIASSLLDVALLDEARVFLKPEHFYSEAHRRMYEGLCALRDAGKPSDVVTLATWLRDADRLAQVGGMAYVTTVLNGAPTLGVRQALAHATSVRDKWARREIKTEGIRLRVRCMTEPSGIEVIIAQARDRLDAVADQLSRSERGTEAAVVIERAVQSMAAARKTDGRGERPTGYDRLDRITAGLHPELVLIGGRPGMAKTALGTAIAVNRAKAGEGAYIASLETQDGELMTRMLCTEAGVSVHRARSGGMMQADLERMRVAKTVLAPLPLWVDDMAASTVAELWAKCRRQALRLRRDGRRMGIVVVDYIQLLRGARSGMKREEVIAENARMLKAMAQELDCPVLALSQLNRQCEARPDKRPMLSDLRESGELEQCARTVMLLYRSDYYRSKEDPKYAPTRECEVNVAKQNNGPTGVVKLRFEEESVAFSNLPEGGDWRDER